MNVVGQVDSALLEAVRGERLDSVEGAFAYSGGEDLTKPGLGDRRRTRLTLGGPDGRTYELYLKRYSGGLAVREFANISAARAAGIPTMQGVIWGRRARRSYLIVTAVPGDAIERCGQDFLTRHAGDGAAAELTARLAELVRRFHAAGFVHRDLYSSHVFLDESQGRTRLYLIDLARMFSPRWRRFRWRVKDLAQLKFSMPPRWVEDCWDDFLTAYLGREGAARAGRYDRAIGGKVAAMHRRQQKKKEAAAR